MNEDQKSIVFVSIMNERGEPILLKNYIAESEEMHLLMHIYASLDTLNKQVEKRLQAEDNKSQLSCYLGCLCSVEIQSDEFDIHGFFTASKLRIMIVVRQKNFAIYSERNLQNLMNNIYSLYMKDMFNPFNPVYEDHKVSPSFHKQLDLLISEYQVKLQ